MEVKHFVQDICEYPARIKRLQHDIADLEQESTMLGLKGHSDFTGGGSSTCSGKSQVESDVIRKEKIERLLAEKRAAVERLSEAWNKFDSGQTWGACNILRLRYEYHMNWAAIARKTGRSTDKCQYDHDRQLEWLALEM